MKEMRGLIYSCSPLSRLISGLILCLAMSKVAQAQEVSGWTSLEWDSGSQTLYGYAETDLDDNAATYYAAALNTYLYDPTGNVIAYYVSSRQTDESTVDVEISAHGTPGQTYSQHTEHLAIVQYESDCPDPCRSVEYEDYYDFSSFSGAGHGNVDYEGSVDLFGPGPIVQIRTRAPYIPPTHTSATAQTSVCGDSRDGLIGEYSTNRVDLNPQCTDFNNSAYTQYFTNVEIDCK